MNNCNYNYCKHDLGTVYSYTSILRVYDSTSKLVSTTGYNLKLKLILKNNFKT